jgi:hypothetical protein
MNGLRVCTGMLVVIGAAIGAADFAPALAQVDPAASARPPQLIPIDVTIDKITRVRITTAGTIAVDTDPMPIRPAGKGDGNPDGGGKGGEGTRGCSQIATWTNASFEGGSYRVQAGFAEHELAAASFTLPAAAFPIRIDSLEMIFATSNASVSTTTKWSVLVWDGRPNTGTLVAEYSSDGKLLPHIQLPPGTNGVNVFFQIDPADPDQIIINNVNGTNMFSFAYRIDDHNQGPANPCATSPPTCCNAFPVTDIGGLASAANNWLYGINCGSFGCPPNGGWARFSQLSVFCRPTGDWVMRATYTPLSCQPGVGACCLPDGTCSTATATDCASAGGTYQGDGSLCGSVNCPAPTGACCFRASGGCINLTQANCSLAGGVWRGAGTQCGQIVCFPTGACCLPDGSCVGPVSPEQCAAQNGVFQGNQTSCASVSCPQPTGACCFATGFCLQLTEAECAQGGSWAGPFTTCDDLDGNGFADACEAGGCPPTDWNGDHTVNSTDVSAFINDWFVDQIKGTLVADFDQNGVTNSTDVSEFINLWFGTQGPC